MLGFTFRFNGRCRIHPAYDPREHGRPTDPNCAGCESLYVISLYTRIAARKAHEGDGIDYFATLANSLEQPHTGSTVIEVEQPEHLQGHR